MLHQADILLLISAASIGFLHTLLGPDHYLPLSALARSQNWGQGRTAIIAVLSGIFHLSGSILIGGIVVWLGKESADVLWLHSIRGTFAGWILLCFGIIYLIWGVKKATLNKRHSHRRIHFKSGFHRHTYDHLQNEHRHIHSPSRWPSWIIFIVFVLGPCEPLIALMLMPMNSSVKIMPLLMLAIYSFITLLTMLSAVLLCYWGIGMGFTGKYERYVHVFSGGIISISAVGMLFLGL